MTAVPVPSAVLRSTSVTIRADVAAMHHEMSNNGYWRSDEPDSDRVYTLGVLNGLGGAAGVLAGQFTPGVALAVADLLDLVASFADDCETSEIVERTVGFCRAFNRMEVKAAAPQYQPGRIYRSESTGERWFRTANADKPWLFLGLDGVAVPCDREADEQNLVPHDLVPAQAKP